ncbi:MAG: hypothetical protein ACKVZJ_12180 [Phycisphaerales bacterium]
MLLPLALPLAGCGVSKPRVVYPERLVSPYAFASGQAVWAVAPPKNESGVSEVDELLIGDALVEEIGQVKGLDALPLNRTLSAMRALGMASVDSPAQAQTLAKALQADGIVVSSVTSWHPYQPPRLGLNVALFGGPPPSQNAADGFTNGVRDLQSAASPKEGPGFSPANGPSVVSLVLDASNTAIMRRVQLYGEARVESNDPMGWERYSKSMKLYTRFACHRALELLLESESSRLTPATPPPPGGEMAQIADQAEQAR